MAATAAAGLEVELPDGEMLTGSAYEAKVVFSNLNQRVQVVGYRGPDLPSLVERLEDEARARGYGKVFLKAQREDRPALEGAGCVCEATIDGYFNGHPAAVMSLFVDRERTAQPHLRQQQEILEKIRERPADPALVPLPEGYEMSVAQSADAEDLADLYATVFASYPFPIAQPEYLVSTMASHVVYRIVRDGDGDVVAAASAETDRDHGNAEMTDFATLPDQRGLGLAQHLLAALERDMGHEEIPNLYTIARARSAGMNRVFYNHGYHWTGTLVNNCHIAGRFEDMHVWCKDLAPTSETA